MLSRIFKALFAKAIAFGVPAVVGGALVAVYFHLGVAQLSNPALPKAVIIAVGTSKPGPGLQLVGSGGSLSEATTSTTSETSAGGLIVVTPNNAVLSYDSSSSSPVEIDPSEPEASAGSDSQPSTSTSEFSASTVEASSAVASTDSPAVTATSESQSPTTSSPTVAATDGTTGDN